MLFGAGASFAVGKAGGTTPEIPPLGPQLFGRLAAAYPLSWGAVGPALAAEFMADFELAMHEIYKQRTQQGVELMKHMTHYFARFRLTGTDDAYTLLFRALARRREFFVASLNYECLAEQALSRCGIEADVLKIHGSCDFFPSGPRFIGGTFNHVEQLTSGLPIKRVPVDEVVRRYEVDGEGLPAVMALYAPGKPVLLESDFMWRLWQGWDDAVSAADELVVIGAKYAPADQHVWAPIVYSRCHVMYVGDADSAKALCQAKPHRVLHVGERFEEFAAQADWVFS